MIYIHMQKQNGLTLNIIKSFQLSTEGKRGKT